MVNDRQSPPSVVIRDDQYVINTPSLLTLGSEPVPDELVKDLLAQEWVPTEAAPKPDIIVKDERNKIDFGRNDVLQVSIENYQEQFTGHTHDYVDLEISLLVEIQTKASRQRMWNLMAEVRRIWYKWKLALIPYHSLYFDGFQPEYIGPNNFQGTLRLRLTAGAVPAMSRFTQGSEAPSVDPSLFPSGTEL